MRKIFCNNCYRRLTKKELLADRFQWQYSGDMYCMRCSGCVDDCEVEYETIRTDLAIDDYKETYFSETYLKVGE
jgi:ferredoxin